MPVTKSGRAFQELVAGDPKLQRALGLVGVLSGDPAMAEAGQVMLNPSGVGGSRAKTMRLGPYGTVLHDPTSGRTWEDPLARQAVEDMRRHQESMAGKRSADRKAEREYEAGRMPDTTRRQWSEGVGLTQQGVDILNTWAKTGSGVKDFWQDLPSDIAEGAGWGWGSRAYQEMVKTAPERDVRTKIERYIAKVRKSELGSALTDMERILGERWNPLAPGIGQRTAMGRFRALVDEVNRKAQAQALGYRIPGDYEMPEIPSIGDLMGGESQERERSTSAPAGLPAGITIRRR